MAPRCPRPHPILPAGGVGESGALGTDATLIVESIRSLLCTGMWGHPGIGGPGKRDSQRETALELLAANRRSDPDLEGALVEGAVAAAVAAAAGKTLEEVEAEACATWGAKLGPSARLVEESEPTDLPSDARVESVLGHPHGLHVRRRRRSSPWCIVRVVVESATLRRKRLGGWASLTNS